jgi:hypothetical protein
LKPGWIALWIGSGILFGGVAFFAFRAGQQDAALGILAFVVLSAFFIGRARVVLDETAITHLDGLRERRLDIANIRGRRTQQAQYFRFLILESALPGGKPLEIPLMYKLDGEFEELLKSIPDLDAQEVVAAKAELATRHSTSEIARAKVVARLLSGASVGAFVWLYAFPRPWRYAVAANAILPMVALLLLVAGGGLYAADQRKNDPRPTVVVALLAPSCALALRALYDLQLLTPSQLVAPTLAGAFAMAAIATLADPTSRARPWSFLILFPLLAGWSGGLLSLTNCAFDRARGEAFSVRVLEMHEGSGRHHTYTLQVTEWGPPGAPREVDVPRALYRQLKPGEAVRVVLRPGRFGMPWFYVLP